VYQYAAALGCEGIVSKRKGSRYTSGRSPDWIKTKNPDAPAVRRRGIGPMRAQQPEVRPRFLVRCAREVPPREP